MIALVKISIWEQIFTRGQSKASRDVVPVFCILVMHHPRDSSVQLAQSLETYFCRWLLQEGFVDNGTMSYTALVSSGAKYIWHSWMYFCCTCNGTAAVNHVINLCLPLYTIQEKLQSVNCREPDQFDDSCFSIRCFVFIFEGYT